MQKDLKDQANATIIEVIDLEEYAASEKKPPKEKHYRIRIDKAKYVVEVPEMTGRQLLELAEKQPVERWRIDQRFKGGKTKRIGLDETTDFTEIGVERYMTMPLDQTEG